MRLFRFSDESFEVIPERSYRDNEVSGFGEITLENFIIEHPEIIPSEEIDSNDPPKFIVIKKQAGVTPGSMDILMLDHKGIPTIIEAKLIDNREIRRSVLAQGLEYISHLQREWTAERIHEAGRKYWQELGLDFENEFSKRIGIQINNDFLEKISSNINANRLRLIIASDKIPSELSTVIEYLNETSIFDVFGLEVIFFANNKDNYKILAPKIVGYSEKQSSRFPWNMEKFFTVLNDNYPDEIVSVAENLLKFGNEVSEKPVEWGTGKNRGSFTARFIYNGERFSLFSVYTSGQFSVNIGWNYKKLQNINSKITEKYRDIINKTFSVDINRNTWENGWPMINLSIFIDDYSKFKNIVTNYVNEIRVLLDS